MFGGGNRGWHLTGVILVLWLCAGFKAAADSIEQLEDYPDDLLILKFSMGSKILLAENILAYPNRFADAEQTVHESIALSFAEFATAVEFSITLDAENGRASGWFIEPQRDFSLDLAAGKAVIDGKTLTLNPQQLQWYQDELYVDIRLLSEWFGVTFDYHPLQQSLDMTSSQVLPFQRRWARQSQREKLNQWLKNNENEVQAKLDLPLFTTPYDWISKPDFQLYSNMGYKYQDGGKGTESYQYNGTIYHDLLYQGAKWYFKGNERNGLDDIRLTLGRQDDNKGLAGFGLSEYTIGDSYSFDVPLVSYSALGSGVSVSSFDPGFRTQANAVTIRGDGQPGWDIELYRNTALINAGKVANDGTYEFVAVPLLSGINEVKLVFYGPRGEKQEKTERYYMHPELAGGGEFNWRASWHRQDERLLDDWLSTPEREHTGRVKFVFQSEYGFSDSLSLSSGLVSVPVAGQQEAQKYATLGSRFTLGRSYFRQQLIRNLTNRSTAWELFASSQFEDMNFNASHQQFSNDYVSEYRRSGDQPLASQTQFNLHHNYSNLWFSHLSLGLKAKYEQFHGGLDEHVLTLKQSMAKGSMSVTNEVNVKDTVVDGENLV